MIPLRKFIVIIHILVGYNSVNAQIYHKLIDTTSVWLQNDFWYGDGVELQGNFYKYYFRNDTLIDDVQFKKLERQSQYVDEVYDMYGYSHYEFGAVITSTFAYMREDTLNRKIFFKKVGDLSEYLLYDFDLTVGDTLPFTYNDLDVESTNYVVSIDSVLIGENYRKRYDIECMGGWCNDENYFDLIEGVGSTFGLVTWFQPLFEDARSLICFTNRGYQIIFNELHVGNMQYDVCEFYPVGIDDLDKTQDLTIYPNPVNDYLLIKNTNSEGQKYFVIIYDVNLKQLYSAEKFISSNITEQFNLSDLNAGIYFVQIKNDSKFQFFKIVKN